MQAGRRIRSELRTVEAMIRIYCRNHHAAQACVECEELLNYSRDRLLNCRYGESKMSCKKCPVHCYKPAMRQKIKEVMRYSGKRIILYDPPSAINHYFTKFLCKFN